jgi:hypothetical protein
MSVARRRARTLAALVAAVVIAVAAATAVASVTVYSNKFTRKSDVKEMRHGEGKRCKKKWRKKAESLRIDVRRGPEVCGYRPPVEGVAHQPDHSFQAKEKLLRPTPKSVRNGAYLSITVRAGGSSGYELRVFPTVHRFKLVRSPAGGGGGFPVKGRSSAIKGFRKPNTLRLRAFGDEVTAKVNGTRVAKLTDANPGEVRGRRLEVAIGHTKRTRKPVVGNVDSLRLDVPSP